MFLKYPLRFSHAQSPAQSPAGYAQVKRPPPRKYKEQYI